LHWILHRGLVVKLNAAKAPARSHPLRSGSIADAPPPAFLLPDGPSDQWADRVKVREEDPLEEKITGMTLGLAIGQKLAVVSWMSDEGRNGIPCGFFRRIISPVKNRV